MAETINSQENSLKADPPQEARYRFTNIRALLMEGFSAEELRRFCFDQPEFRPVYDELSYGMGKSEIAERLLAYAEKMLLVENPAGPAATAQPGPVCATSALHYRRR